MPYDYASDKTRVNAPIPNWDDHKYEVVTYNPCPHYYGTLNLPTWDRKDWPFNPQCVNLKHTTFARFDTAWKRGVVDLGQTIRPLTVSHLSVNPFFWSSGSSGGNFSYGHLNYQGNLPHFTHHGKGAFSVHDGELRHREWGFCLGQPDLPSRTRQQAKVYTPQRWMNSVFGVQFEWDSGIPFPNNHVGDHMPAAVPPPTVGGPIGPGGPGGYQIENLWISMGMVSTRGCIIEDFLLPLVKDGRICKDIVYWYEGYSLFDPIEWNGSYVNIDDSGNLLPEDEQYYIPGQGKEETTPTRSGRCGFAMSSSHPNFEIVANARIPTTDVPAWEVAQQGPPPGLMPCRDKIFIPYSKFVGVDDNMCFPVHEEDNATEGERVKIGANTIMTGMVMTFRGHGATASTYNTFRMWNWKPITVPVKYMTESEHEVDNKKYQPYLPENFAPGQEPIVGVDNTKEGCPCPPLINEEIGLADPSFEAVVPAPHSAWNGYPLGIKVDGTTHDEYDRWEVAELGYHKGQTVSSTDKHQDLYEEMLSENMLTTSWFTKEFADELDAKGWYLYDTDAHKQLNFRVSGPPFDKGTYDDISGNHIRDLDEDEDVLDSDGKYSIGDFGWFSSDMTPTQENTHKGQPYKQSTNSYYNRYRKGRTFNTSDELYNDGMKDYVDEIGDSARRETDTAKTTAHQDEDVYNWPVDPPS